MKIIYFVVITLLFFNSVDVYSQAIFDIESGLVWSSYNDARIPGDKGSDISFSEDLEEERTSFYRLRLGYHWSNHIVSFLYAPLNVKSKGTLDRDIVFANKTFEANQEISSEFIFNSYRLTYRYTFFNNKQVLIGAGLTAKIRQARISLENNTQKAEKENVGFVPLINFSLQIYVIRSISVLIEGDALYAKQGRAEDVQAALQYHFNKNVAVRAGYRILEGGADNDEVYTFSLFNYAFIGLTLVF